MVALRARRGFWNILAKPAKPSARGNAVAFKAGKKAFKKKGGSTPELQHVVFLALQSDDRL